MRKMMISLLAVTMLLSGCGKKEAISEETTVPSTTEEVIAVTEQEASVPETEPAVVVTEPIETEEATEPPTEPPTEPAGEPGIVVNAQKLNVREEPSVNAKKVTQLKSGTQVRIYETVENAGMTWGRIDLGWVSMDYIRLEDAPVLQQKPAEGQTPSDNREDKKPAVNEDTDHDKQENKNPEHDNTPDVWVPSPSEPDKNEPLTPSVPENTESIPEPTIKENVVPEPSIQEDVVPEPTQHQHHWTPVQNIPAEYEDHGYVICKCGAKFKDAAEWTSHRDTYLGSEDISDHTGYSSGSDQVEISPAQVVWKCNGCDSSKTLGAGDNP